MPVTGEELKESMRRWATGVAVVTSVDNLGKHGMTVNSFISISIEPPLICVTLANDTRTKKMVEKSHVFGVTILSDQQEEIANRFSGRIPDIENRFQELGFFTMESGVPFLVDGLGFLDCVVKYKYAMKNSTLFVGEVISTKNNVGSPLIYHNRKYHQLKE
ncbi:MAG: flavin reductase [Anaerolineaceae bacterium]|nr:flavin reductase [Anaerolineaceae bacterium]